jgi:aspartate/methionine/tyrosine aminotransferase
MTIPLSSLFRDDHVPFALLRERAFNLRWATLPPDVIPLTAADPDFAVAAPIIEAMTHYLRGGVLSYGPAEGLPAFRTACATRRERTTGHACDPSLLMAVDSAAAGMHHIARFALAPGDDAIVFDPVDFLFKASVEAAGGTVRLLPLDPTTGRLDLAQLPALLTPRTRLLGVCNPLNPLGQLLTADELRVLGEFAVAHDLWILNDEIWSDIVFDGVPFVSLPTLSPAIAARTFTVHGFSKSFGLAGLRIGYVLAPDAPRFEHLMDASLARTTMTGAATVSQIGAAAACNEGEPWLQAFVAHLQRMRDLAVHELRAIPGVQVDVPAATYVIFPDVSAWAQPATRLQEALLERHRVAVVPGAERWFGPGATGHLRLCFATSEGVLREGLGRVRTGLEAMRALG